MLRMSVCIAILTLILGSFAGCSSQKTTRLNKSGKADKKEWIQANPAEVLEAKTEKEPAITSSTFYAAALLLEHQGKYNQAVEKYNQAIQADPNSIASYNRIALLYMKMKKYDLATKTLKDVINEHPQSALLHNNLGFAYLLQHKNKHAEAELRNALVINPDFKRAHANLGIALARQGKREEALNHLVAGGSAAQGYYNLGLIMQSQGKLKLAKEYYDSALEFNPKFSPAITALKKLPGKTM